MSHKNKWIFCHVPKAAGTSVRLALRPYSDVEGCTDNQQKHGFEVRPPYNKQQDIDFFIHNPSWEICEIAKQKKGIDVSDYFKFSFVRNPWDRVLSLYLYKKRESEVVGEKRQYHADLYVKQTSGGFGHFVKNYLHDQRMQIRFLKNLDKKNADICCDFIGRFENLNEDFAEICRRIGLPEIDLPVTNTTKHKHYSEYYTEQTKQIVENYYAEDIKYFNYEF